MVLPAPVRVPARVLAHLVDDVGLGELHKTLAPEPLWLPDEERDTLRAECRALVTALGWWDRLGNLEREVVRTLAVLCRPSVEHYGWITHEERTVGVLAGRIGKEAVLAVREPDATVRLSNIGAARLAERLVAQTPDMPAGHGTPFSAAMSEVRATRDDGRLRTPAGVGVRRASPDARRIRQLAALPATGFGVLSVASRDEWGGRHRAPRPLRYTDTSDGRYLTLVDATGEHLRLMPADGKTLVEHLVRLADSLPT